LVVAGAPEAVSPADPIVARSNNKEIRVQEFPNNPSANPQQPQPVMPFLLFVGISTSRKLADLNNQSADAAQEATP
jgi:hypothetical protein